MEKLERGNKYYKEIKTKLYTNIKYLNLIL
ncbi:hypothetical protein ES703_61023 [subsurface metagenome]